MLIVTRNRVIEPSLDNRSAVNYAKVMLLSGLYICSQCDWNYLFRHEFAPLATHTTDNSNIPDYQLSARTFATFRPNYK